MTNKSNNQFFSYDDKTYKKGIQNYAYVDALFLIRNSIKLQLSYKGHFFGRTYFENVCFENAKSWLKDHSNKISVKKVGRDIESIVYI